MRQGSFRLLSALACVLALALAASPAFAQGGAGNTTLSGSIVDSSGGVIPGADVTAKNNATATVYTAVSEADGRWTIPAIAPGAYTVTIAMMGFKSVVLPDVQVITGTPATVKAVTLEVGQLSETVTVTGATEIVQTQSAAVTSTLTTQQINRTPQATRNTLDFVSMLPGVSNTQGARYSTVMGLPGSALNITIDGLNTMDQALKGTTGSAFFSNISPRLDAVEEVTVSTANPGAEASGQGAVQVRFQTRSGTNKLAGSAYHYMRRTQWDTPYWFNTHQNVPAKPADASRVDTFGGRLGGPIIKDRAFFFFNYEEFRQPLSIVRTRTVLNADALAGKFDYSGGQVDLYALAKKYGQTSTPDPAIGQMLTDINATLAGQSVTAGSNSITNTLSFSNSASQRRIYPTMRGDVNVTTNNRVGVSFYIQRYTSTPDLLNNRDAAFPGYEMQGNQTSWRPALMGNWRSVLGPSVVNEVRMGYTGWTGTHFSDNITPDMFPGGRALTIPLINTPYTISNSNNYEIRSSPNLNVEDTLNWIKGKHTFTFGGSFTRVGYNDYYQYYVPRVGIGFDSTNDPAAKAGMFDAANFPGINSTDLSNARSLYALLTGRVTSLNNTAFLNPATGQYEYMGPWQYWVQQKEMGFFAQDSWKLSPALTLTAGLRYQLQLPFTSANHFFTQLTDYNMVYGVSGLNSNGQPNYFYTPGMASNGIANPQFEELKPGVAPFKTDTNNLAPSVGLAWRVPVKSGGFLAKLLSDDPVIRGGYSKSFTREGMSTTSGIYSYNPGGSILVNRNMSLGNLVAPGQSLPLLYRDTANLNAPTFPDTPSYPLAPSFSNSINAFYPATQTPWVHSFNVSFQRSLTKDTAIDVRYVGTRARGGWVDGGRNINELNMVENGFTEEFKHAQANYLINEQTYGWNSKAGNSFAYNGLPGQSPLPIFQAFYGGTTNAASPSAYTSSQYTSSTNLAYLVPTNPNVSSLASPMFTDSTMRNNGLKAGLPANFFYMNPAISGGVYVTGRPEDSVESNFDALQIELRRRMNNGLLLQGSYQYTIRSESSAFLSVRVPAVMYNREVGRSDGAPVHTFKMNWVYELPFGQGKHFLSNVSRGWNRLVGGWSFDGVARLQTGQVLDFGNVLLVGMTDADLQNMFNLRYAPDPTDPRITRVYMLPQDVIDNTIKAFSTSYSSATGYSAGAPTGRYFAPIMSNGCLQTGYAGSCTVDGKIVPASTPIHHYVNGPNYFRFDMSVSKRMDITSKVFGELRLEALNVFDNVDFYGVVLPTSNVTNSLSYQVTGAYRDINNSQDPGGRLLQVSYRISF